MSDSLKGVRVLMAEDSATQAAILRLILEEEGASVEHARDGREGAALFEREDFHIVLSDIVMPEMDGFELCRHIKGLPRGRKVPVILLTAMTDPTDIIRGLEAGADSFITKPYEPVYLIERIKGILAAGVGGGNDKLRPGGDAASGEAEQAIQPGRRPIVDMLIATFEETARKGRELEARHRDLEQAKAKVEEYARRLEGLVKVSEDKYDVLLENANDAIFTLDYTGRVLKMNRRGEEMFGAARVDVVGRRFLDFMPADRRERAGEEFVRRRGEVGIIAERAAMTRKDGRPFYAEIASSQATIGGETLLLVVIRDVTERVAMEQRTAVQLAATAVLASAGSFAEAAPRLLESMCVALEWHWAVFWLMDPVRKGLMFNSAWAPPGIDTGPYLRGSAGFVHDRGEGLQGRAWDSGQVVWVPDASLDPDLVRTSPITGLVLEAGIRMTVAIPISCEGAVMAVMVLGRREPGEPDERLIGTFAMLGGHIGQYIERKLGEERLKMSEDQLRQALKMEAMGKMASGVAHDFNNLITVISGYGELLLENKRPDDPDHEMISAITKAADQATALTRQLLAFSRKQKLTLKVLDLNAVVEDAKKILGSVIGAGVELATSLKPGLGAIRADPGQLNQVIMNLAVNARDAMPGGGRLLIETADIIMEKEAVSARPLMVPGPYVQLAVTDTGTGMDAETKARIFEPFFTTKEQGKGTGLGLSTVYGIVQQSGGHIFIYSEPGHGTCFKIYFPRVEGVVGLDDPDVAGKAEHGHVGGTVLVVEDEGGIRELVCKVLRGSGFEVLAASGSAEALAHFEHHRGEINLLVTDMVMPGMHGAELAEKLTAGIPGLRVLFMSGYTEQGALERALLRPGHMFLQKPFTPAMLLRKVGETLGAHSG
jgi:PAS domain S-box-containing protein